MFVRVLAIAVLAGALVAAQTDRRETILVTRVFPTAGQLGLFVANADGTGERRLLTDSELAYNPTWSPDGTWLVFASEREGSADLYRMHADGSARERLTDSPAYDDQASVSPDGGRVVFVSTRGGGTADLWTLDIATRRAQPLTSGPGGDFRPSWSPDGQWIAFSSDRGKGLPFSHGRWEAMQVLELYLVHPDGTGLRRLGESGGFCGSPKWSGDSRHLIAYCMSPQDTIKARWGATTEDGTTTLRSFDVSTGAASDIEAGPGVKIAPSYLRGGTVAFVRKDEKAAGIYDTNGRTGPTGAVQTAAWSPDGARVAYHKFLHTTADTLGTTIWSRLPGFELRLGEVQPSFNRTGDRYVMANYTPTPDGNNLIVVDAATSKRTVIFHDAHRSVLAPQWSPSGETVMFGIGHFGLFFNSFHDELNGNVDRIDGGAQVAAIRSDGTRFREITTGPNNNGSPSPSPDGRRIVYRTFGPEGDGLRILDLQSGAVTTLTRGYANFPLWSPRGDLIMFSSVVDNDYEIFTIKPDGTGQKRLTTSSGNDAHQGWSPDGQHIVFASARMGFKDEVTYTNAPQPYGDIFVMRADGSDVQQLTDNQWEEGTPAWQPRGVSAARRTRGSAR